MKSITLATLFAALLINALAAFAWDQYTQRLVERSQARNASELVLR
jgi:hypothetical protein